MSPTLSIILALVAIIPGVWSLVRQNRKDKRDEALEQQKIDLNEDNFIVDNAGKLVGNAMSLLGPYERRIKVLEDTQKALEETQKTLEEQQEVLIKKTDSQQETIDLQERIIKSWTDGIKLLINQLKEANMIPIWTPDDVEFNSRKGL